MSRVPDAAAVRAAVEAVAAAGAVPVVMSYWNPIERYGVDRFATDLAAAGGAGAITPDLIPDEAAGWIAAADRADLDRVFLVAPSSTDARLRYTTEHCRGFVYATAVMGVTGTRTSSSDLAGPLVAHRCRGGSGGARSDRGGEQGAGDGCLAQDGDGVAVHGLSIG